MNKSILTLGLLFASLTAFGYDIITLTSRQKFEGKIKKIKDCVVYFKVEKETFQIPAQEILSVEFHNPKDKVLISYLELPDTLSTIEKCLRGRQDAELFHGKETDHFLFGVLFGIIGVMGAAAANPTPAKGMDTYQLSQNKDLFSDPIYLKCYRKKAMAKNIKNTFIGWGTIAGIVLYLYSTTL